MTDLKKTTVVSIYAGPGVGKSVLAAEVFVELKKQGKSVELVTEFIKKWAWLGHPVKGWADSLYIFGKQLRAESIVWGKVDYLVTDCPLGLSVAYEAFYRPDERILACVYDQVRKQQEVDGVVTNLNFHLMRQFDYKPEGRYETEEQARRVDNVIRNLIPGFHVKSAKDVLEILTHHQKDHR